MVRAETPSSAAMAGERKPWQWRVKACSRRGMGWAVWGRWAGAGKGMPAADLAEAADIAGAPFGNLTPCPLFVRKGSERRGEWASGGRPNGRLRVGQRMVWSRGHHDFVSMCGGPGRARQAAPLHGRRPRRRAQQAHETAGWPRRMVMVATITG